MPRKKSRKSESDRIDEAKDSSLEKEDSTKKTQKKKEDNKIPFNAWFGLLGRKKAWLRKSAWEWMKAQGLSEMEEKDKYDKAWKKF